MSRLDRLHYLVSIFNRIALNEIDRLNGSNTYQSILGISTKIVPNCLKKNEKVLRIYIGIIVCTSPFWSLSVLIKALCSRLRSEHISCYEESKIFLPASIALPRVVKNANINDEADDKWLLLPWNSVADIPESKIITVFNLLNVHDIWRAYCDSIIVIYYYYFKKGYRFVLPVTRSFMWFLYCNAIKHIPLDVELVFANHKDSYAPLFDILPHTKKTLVQHGTEILMENVKMIGEPYYHYCEKYKFWTHNMPFKYKNISSLYCFTKKEYMAMSMSVLNCSPQVEYVGYSLKEFNENLEGEKAVLIIGYYDLYYEREKKLISLLQDKGVRIYLKNHPLFPASVYNHLLQEYEFVLLNGPRFPKVDVVFSYSSTLALEYEDLGSEIILYDGFDDKKLKEYVDSVIDKLGKML